MAESENGSEQNKEPPKPKLMDPKKFFISHVNSYTGKVLHEELSTEPNKMIDIS